MIDVLVWCCCDLNLVNARHRSSSLEYGFCGVKYTSGPSVFMALSIFSYDFSMAGFGTEKFQAAVAAESGFLVTDLASDVDTLPR